MNTIALRKEQWVLLVKWVEQIRKSEFYKKINLFIKLCIYAIKTGDNLPLKEFIIENAAHFFNIEVEEDNQKPKKNNKRKRIIRFAGKIILFPLFMIYIIGVVLLEKKKGKIKNRNIYIET